MKVSGPERIIWKRREWYIPFLDGGVEIATRTEFHDFTPVHSFILNEIDGLDDVGMVQGGGDAKLCGEFLDVFLFALVFATFAEFLTSWGWMAGDGGNEYKLTLTA